MTKIKRRVTRSYHNFVRHQPSVIAIVKNLVFKMANNSVETDDFMSIAEEQVLWCISNYSKNGGGSFTTLLYGRIHNKLRHARDVETRAKRPFFIGDEQLAIAVSDNNIDVSIMVEECLSHLTKDEKDVVVKIFLEDKTIRNVAEELGISSGTVHNRKKNALTKMTNKCCKV